MRTTFFGIFICLLISCLGYARQPNVEISYPKAEIEFYEKKLMFLVNQERVKHGLRPLAEWTLLYEPAIKHCQRMANRKVAFGHSGFEKRTEEVSKKANISAFGENLAYCLNVEDPLVTSVEMWMSSPGHRANILDSKFTHAIIAIALDEENGFFITQLFAKRL